MPYVSPMMVSSSTTAITTPSSTSDMSKEVSGLSDALQSICVEPAPSLSDCAADSSSSLETLSSMASSSTSPLVDGDAAPDVPPSDHAPSEALARYSRSVYAFTATLYKEAKAQSSRKASKPCSKRSHSCKSRSRSRRHARRRQSFFVCSSKSHPSVMTVACGGGVVQSSPPRC